MFRFLPRIAAVILLVVAGALAPATAEERPFNASGAGRVVSNNLQGRDEATHLGSSTLLVPLYTDFLYSGIFLPFGGSLESANRNFLHFAFDKEAYFFDAETGVVSATLTFTGGTGRFQDATGSADVMFDFDSSFESFDFVIDGSIDY